jgi:hypothetical protein
VLRQTLDLRAVQIAEKRMHAKQRPLVERLAQSRLVAGPHSHGKLAGNFPNDIKIEPNRPARACRRGSMVPSAKFD